MYFYLSILVSFLFFEVLYFVLLKNKMIRWICTDFAFDVFLYNTIYGTTVIQLSSGCCLCEVSHVLAVTTSLVCSHCLKTCWSVIDYAKAAPVCD